jgi:hypothetical protein
MNTTSTSTNTSSNGTHGTSSDGTGTRGSSPDATGTRSRTRACGSDTPVARAGTGTGGWEDAVRLQRWADADHGDFYALAGEVVATLYALEDLASVLERQVARYGQGRVLYDDTRQVDPADRLQAAVHALQGLHDTVVAAGGRAEQFFTAIGHLGVDNGSPTDPGGVDR